MNLDPALLEILVCPGCRGALAVDEAASELACTSCGRPTRSATTSRSSSSTRPVAPRRPSGVMVEPFDDSRLDDESALASADHALRPLAEAGARVRREAGEAGRGDRRGGGQGRRRLPPPGRGRRRPRLAAAAGGPRAVVPGAVRRLARTLAARLGRRARPGRRARARGQRHRLGVRGRRGGPPGLPGGGRLPAPLAGGRARRRPRQHGAAVRVRRPARHGRGDARSSSTGSTSVPTPSPRRWPRPSTTWRSPARRTGTWR